MSTLLATASAWNSDSKKRTPSIRKNKKRLSRRRYRTYRKPISCY